MGSILDLLKTDDKDIITIYGCDTETYADNGEYGLKSIQIWNPDNQLYITSHDYALPNVDIRQIICSKFGEWLCTLTGKVIVAFFNMQFDFSQIVYWLVHSSGWEYLNPEDIRGKVRKGCFTILETDTNIYKVTINTGPAYIVFMDVANFLTATSLNRACSEWIGECKVDVDSKKFPKAFPTDLEKQYAMKDAELTYKLFVKLDQEGVIEDTSYVTIAGRTMGHFKDYIKRNFGLSFNQFAYGEYEDSEVEEMALEWEGVLRPFTRGGICRAFRTGLFTNCHHIDARSMYPSQCDLDKIPHGPVLYHLPKDKDYTTIYYPVGHFYLKEGKISGIQFRRKSQCVQYAWTKVYEPSEYVDDMYLDGTFPIWEAEYKILLECFHCDDLDDSKRVYVEMIDNHVLKKYIRFLYDGKMNNKGTKRNYFKILMNALYGKFLTRPDGVLIDYSEGERRKVMQDGKRTYYLPLGNWIAMMGRVSLMKCLLSIPKDNLLYCDTDSCIYIGDIHPNVKIGKYLGEWGIENDNFSAWIVGPKTYQELNEDGTLITKCAGLSNEVRAQLPFMALEEGKTFLVNKARRDPETWAINIMPTEFTISTKAQAFRGGT